MEMGSPPPQRQNQFLKTRGRISVAGSACHNGRGEAGQFFGSAGAD